MFSFYGGQPGQSFKITAIFPNRATLLEDLKQGMFSPVGLNEYVYINYGTQNEEANLNWTEENEETIQVNAYNYNRLTDNKNYGGKSYNGTLWQKIIGNNLEQEEDSEEGSSDVLNKYKYYKYGDTPQFITEIEPSSTETVSDNGEQETNNSEYKYICVGSFTGTTPIFGVGTEILAPADNPDVTIDSTNIDNPILTFKLPRAVKFWFGQITNNQWYKEGMGRGDYIVDTESGQIAEIAYNTENSSYYLIQQPIFLKPTSVKLTMIDTYDENGNINQGINQINYNSDNGTWSIDFNLPQIPTIEGTAKSGDPGSNPSVIISPQKSSSKLKFDFVIPKGDKGDVGPAGSLKILTAITNINNDPELDNISFITNLLEERGETIANDEVLPIIIIDSNEESSAYWCTFNDVWSIQPLGGGAGTAILEWEELD